MTGEEGLDILGETFSHIIKNLQSTHHQLDRESFNTVAKMIAEATGDLYIMAARSSYALAYIFHGMIQRILPRCQLLGPQPTTLPDCLLNIQTDDLLFAIFRHPYSRETFKVAQHFADRGVPIILLTDSAFSPLEKTAHVQLVVNTEGVSIFSSLAAVIAVLESLNVAILKYCDEQTVQSRLEQMEKLLAGFDTFCQPRPGRAPLFLNLGEPKKS